MQSVSALDWKVYRQLHLPPRTQTPALHDPTCRPMAAYQMNGAID